MKCSPMLVLLLLSSPLPLSSRALSASCPWTEGDLSPFLQLPPEGQEEPPFAVCGPHVLPLVEMPEEETQNQVYHNHRDEYFDKVQRIAKRCLANPSAHLDMDRKDLKGTMWSSDDPVSSLHPITWALVEEREGCECCWIRGDPKMKIAGYLNGAKSATMVALPNESENTMRNNQDLVLICARLFPGAQSQIEDSDFNDLLSYHFGFPYEAEQWPRAVWIYVESTLIDGQRRLSEERLRMVQYLLDLNSWEEFYFKGREGTFKALYLYRGFIALPDGNLLFRLDLTQGGRVEYSHKRREQSSRFRGRVRK